MDGDGDGNPSEWIRCDESAGEMLARVALERPALLLPPLHRVPLRPGNVVEIVGPSPSAKSEILIQAAISCILPKDANGVHLGGMGRLVVYFDLDCRFSVLRLAHCLKARLSKAYESDCTVRDNGGRADGSTPYDDELFQSCMRRFLYIRCYNSLEFLAALKTMRCYIHNEIEAQGIGVYFLMIDSINAFYWMDRAYQSPSSGPSNRKSLSLQSIMEAVVQEVQKFLQAQRVLILVTKSSSLGFDVSSHGAQWMLGRTSKDVTESAMLSRESEKYSYRENMPSVWQVFVTHRMCIRVAEERSGDSIDLPIYTSEWILPPLNLLDRFAITDVGITIIP